jgi:hypothetical protein
MGARPLSLYIAVAIALAGGMLSMTSSLCFGQAFTANLTGLITDPSGAALTNVTVKIVNSTSGETRQTLTGAEGRYTFSQLLPSTYELTAEASGFKTLVQKDIILRANQSGEVTFTMQLGEVTESIEVAGVAIQLDTQTANQTVTLNQDMVLNLPVNARNPFVLVYVTAAHGNFSGDVGPES